MPLNKQWTRLLVCVNPDNFEVQLFGGLTPLGVPQIYLLAKTKLSKCSNCLG